MNMNSTRDTRPRIQHSQTDQSGCEGRGDNLSDRLKRLGNTKNHALFLTRGLLRDHARNRWAHHATAHG